MNQPKFFVTPGYGEHTLATAGAGWEHVVHVNVLEKMQEARVQEPVTLSHEPECRGFC
jgi:hypothetical protein